MIERKWRRPLPKNNENDGGGAVLRGGRREEKKKKRREREIEKGTRNLILQQQFRFVVI